MGEMASQITGLTIVYSTIHSGADQRKLETIAWTDVGLMSVGPFGTIFNDFFN